MSVTVKDLSKDQLVAYDSIRRWIDTNPAHAPHSEEDYGEEEDEGSEFDANEPAVYQGRDAPLLTLGGFAGTGKSTLVSLVAEQISLPAFCAYTGKAASVLKRKLAAAGTVTVGTQKKGSDPTAPSERRPYCGTIHSLIYRPCECREPASVTLEKACPEENCPGETMWTVEGHSKCTKGHVGLIGSKNTFDKLKPKTKFIRASRDENGRCRHCGGKEWLRREVLDRNYSVIIVDEASMVDEMTLRDLRGYGVPILAVGDHGQLPPVGGSGKLMQNPMVRLERIHRQAEGNPIIALSKIIRETGGLPDTFDGGDAVKFERLRFVERILEERYAEASAERLLEMGIACYTNKRRVGLNVAVRRARGIARVGRELPVKGEHVVCLRNQKGRGQDPIFNGMRGVLTSDVAPKPNYNKDGKKIGESDQLLVGSIAFPEDGVAAREYEMLAKQFNRDKTFQEAEELARETGFRSFASVGGLFDFGYAMTGHKFQGSQVDDLLMCAERPGPVDAEGWRRWLYTVVTRAANKITVLR